ncbi:unnamed protein product [Adineta ricciae]|uniref:Metalloendopeptidase n=1 Tax=Adineta ricciae TaxID=249248 RepID=A0A815LP62_ADIRI|nr:unnamed protein product [Adineta ricciae]CAF1410124.1 unnamed protein product [Adineta ricciae]
MIEAQLFQGDMRFPPVTRPTGRSLAATSATSTVTWPDGIVPYEFVTGYSLEEEMYIVDVMRKLELLVAVNLVRCVQFRPRISSDQYYIIIENGAGCSSYVGQNPGVTMNRTVTLQSPGCLSDGVVLHELLHTLGFHHEQSRPDRDNYVRINLNNVQTGMESQFQKYTSRVTTLNTQYDYQSVMHYASTAFSRNGLATIEPLQANVTIGQRDSLSLTDIQAVRILYNCTTQGVTLPPPTTQNITSSFRINSTYSSRLTTSSARFSRYNGVNGSYYYEAIQITVPTAGNYRFRSVSVVDTYGYLYLGTFLSSSPERNLLVQNDDSAGNNQFQFTLSLQTNTTYVLVITTYSANVTGAIDVVVSGPQAVNFLRLGSSETVSTTAYSNYTGALTNSSALFTRYDGAGRFYYEALLITVSTNGTYNFTSSSSIDMYGYLYVNNISAYDLSANLLAFNDDSAGNMQFLITSSLVTGRRYILICTTYGPTVTGRYSAIVSGLAQVGLKSISLALALPSTSTMLPVTSTRSTTSVSSISMTNYNSTLTNNSSTFSRYGRHDRFYYEALEITPFTNGTYTFTSTSTVDAFGYLYVNNISAWDLSANLVAFNDDDAGNMQFRIIYNLQSGRKYILIFTTYSNDVTGPFSVIVSGPARVTINRINLVLPVLSTTTPSTYSSSRTSVLTTGSSAGCNRSDDRPTCPAQVVTNGRVVTVNSQNRNLTGDSFSPNSTFFNLNDSSPMNGFIQSVTIQYRGSRLPSVIARLWIYTIIPISGGFMICSQYSIPLSQISTSQLIQTYTLPNNTIYVAEKTYIGIGIQDTTASIATTFGSIALRTSSANLSSNIGSREARYFWPDDTQTGVKLSYTIVT